MPRMHIKGAAQKLTSAAILLTFAAYAQTLPRGVQKLAWHTCSNT